MGKRLKIIRNILLSACLSLSLLGSINLAQAADGSTIINAELCSLGNQTDNLTVTNYVNDGTSPQANITLEFSGNWLYSVKTSRNGTTLAESNLTYGANQTFSQSITLVAGLNNLVFETVGSCPHTTKTINFNLTFDPNAVSVNRLITNVTSPQLTGQVADPTVRVMVKILGATYEATNNGDGTWTLPANLIAPPLADNDYDIELTTTDAGGNVIMQTTTPAALTIDTTKPNGNIETERSDQRSPAITGQVNELTSQILVTINGKTYTAVNNGDGTWTLPAGTISPPLVNGQYNTVVTFTDLAGNQTTEQKTITIDAKNNLGTILTPNTGYLRINQTNIPIWMVYLGFILTIIGLITYKKAKQQTTR